MLEAMRTQGIPAAIASQQASVETGASGAEAERENARVATGERRHAHGPNCMGMSSNEVSLHAWGSSSFIRRRGL